MNNHKHKKKETFRSDAKETKPDYSSKCDVCGETPVVPATGMCGPCSFGEAGTAGGNW